RQERFVVAFMSVDSTLTRYARQDDGGVTLYRQAFHRRYWTYTPRWYRPDATEDDVEATHKHSHSFVPAMGLDWLTPLYDPCIRLLLREDEVKQQLVDQARIQPGMTVVDLGCGTGTLALMVKRSHPTARVIGIDVDPKILDIARGKL